MLFILSTLICALKGHVKDGFSLADGLLTYEPNSKFSNNWLLTEAPAGAGATNLYRCLRVRRAGGVQARKMKP